jgi:catechol 2,3-dioxygenase-like lactoylglutathione lyase family enzyme
MENKGSIVTIIVSNLEQSRNFYTEILGFFLNVPRSTEKQAVLETPAGSQYPITVSLTTEIPSGWSPGKSGSVSLGILLYDSEDVFYKAVEELKNKGVKTSVTDEGLSMIAYFVDPDGNPLFIGAHRQLSG